MTLRDDDAFVDRVMHGIERQERRLPVAILALVASVLVLSVPVVVAFRLRAAIAGASALAGAGIAAVLDAALGNAIAWGGLALLGGWLVWLAQVRWGSRR